MQFLFKKEKQDLIKKLEYYGITKLPFLLSVSGKEKIRGYSGMLSIDEIRELDKELGLELIGLYLFHDYEDGIRLSFDAIYALKDEITKNIIELDDKQATEFLKGNEIVLTDQDKEKFKNETRGFKIIKHKEEFLGSGKLLDGRIMNYMPKERRLR
jgi:NOL1/NOP2/fmu family ribosome biogenesis protein